MTRTPVVVRQLDPTEIASAQQNASAIAAVGLKSPAAPVGGRFTIFLAFDGTNNDRTQLGKA